MAVRDIASVDAAEVRRMLAIALAFGGAVGLAAFVTVLSVWSAAGGP